MNLCVLLWAKAGKDSALASYEDRVLRLIADHGGQILQRRHVVADGGEPGNGEPPTEVQFLAFPCEEALDAYLRDPRRAALTPERDAAIARTDVLRISGP